MQKIKIILFIAVTIAIISIMLKAPCPALAVSGVYPKYPPAALPIYKITSNSITAAWGANGNPLGSGIYYYCEFVGYETSGKTKGCDIFSWESTGLAAETNYSFRVQASDDNGTPISYTPWVDLGTKKTMPAHFVANGRELLNGDIISVKPSLEFKITSSLSLNMPTCGIFVNGVKMTDGTAAGGGYDSYTDSHSTLGYTTIAYAPKTAFAAGTYAITIEVNDSDGTICSISAFNLKAVSNPDAPLNPLCYPNPFDPDNGSLRISYELTSDSDISAYIYDITGSFIVKRSFVSGFEGAHAGYNEVTWDGKDDFGQIVRNGPYVSLITGPGGKVLAKMKILVLK